jgi:hypothetical protein
LPSKSGWYFVRNAGEPGERRRRFDGKDWTGLAPGSRPEWTADSPRPQQAPDLLQAALQHMKDRAATYDQEGGERSMGRVVNAFNTITGRDLQEHEGWLLMVLLKLVRDQSAPGGHADSQEDAISYTALYSESRR